VLLDWDLSKRVGNSDVRSVRQGSRGFRTSDVSNHSTFFWIMLQY
jgi:hypothetical protein